MVEAFNTDYTINHLAYPKPGVMHIKIVNVCIVCYRHLAASSTIKIYCEGFYCKKGECQNCPPQKCPLEGNFEAGNSEYVIHQNWIGFEPVQGVMEGSAGCYITKSKQDRFLDHISVIKMYAFQICDMSQTLQKRRGVFQSKGQHKNLFLLAEIRVSSREEYSVQGNSKIVFPWKGYSIQQESQIMLIGGAYSSSKVQQVKQD